MRALSMKLSNWERVFRFRQINFWFIGNPVVVPLANSRRRPTLVTALNRNFRQERCGPIAGRASLSASTRFSQLDLSYSQFSLRPSHR